MSVLVVDKPIGPTSAAVVDRIKNGLRQLWGAARVRAIKIGHGGTLDPLASGVLPVCLGEATKLAPFLLEADKEYVATARFGVETDTQDAGGQVVAARGAPGLTTAMVEAALAGFRGEIEQVPPMYSALKRHGRPLYDYARAGETVVREPRRVRVYELSLLAFESPDQARFHLRCSKGTYVRTLAADLGHALGVGAHLVALRRIASGPFRLEQSVTLDAFEVLVRSGGSLPLVPLADALVHLPALTADVDVASALSHGRAVAVAALGVSSAFPGLMRVLRVDGTLLAVVRSDDQMTVRPIRVFHLEPDARNVRG